MSTVSAVSAAADLTTLPGNTHVAPRFDLYVFIHKALRQFMTHTLGRVGSMDVDDAEQRGPVLDGVEALLAELRAHVQHENDFVHTAIEARRPGGARHTADDHLLHLEAIANLEDETRALRHARDDQRATLALRLYRHLGEFVGENFVHMQVEETQNNAALWALYSDDELVAIHDRLLASVPPAEMALVVRWMAAALNDTELALLFGEMQHKAPPPAVEALLGIARSQLDERRWAKLARALGRPPVPGLVTV
jgi:hypothetical protein